MNQSTFSVLVIIFFTSLNHESLASNDLHHRQKRLVGGDDAFSGEFPHAVSLREYGEMNHFCGGTIISDEHILTAAHCLHSYRLDPENIFAVVGASRLIYDGFTRRISDVKVHSSFSIDHMWNDIAVLRTAEKIVFTARIQPVALPEINLPAEGPTQAVLSGWGRFEVINFFIFTKKNDFFLKLNNFREQMN